MVSENQAHADPSQSPYRWIMLALMVLLYTSFGLVNRSLAPLVTPILRDLRISYSEMGLILGSWQVTFIGGSIVAGILLDRWGIRKSILMGMLIIALSAILRFFPKDFAGMLLAVTLFGAGAPMISIGCPKVIVIWFKGRSREKAVGIYLCGSFAGQLLSLTLTNSLVMPLLGHSWRLTFLCYGLICAAVAGLWWFFGKEAPSSGTGDMIGLTQTFSRLSRIRSVQIVLAMGLLSFATLHGFNNWLPKILEAAGMSPTKAGFIAAIPLGISIPSLLILPGLVPCELRGRFIALASFFTLLAVIAIVTTSGAVQLAALMIYGVVQSSYIPILTLILMDTPEIESCFLGAAVGMFFCVAEVGGFSGPLIMGALTDATGTFLAGSLFFAILNLVLIGLTFSLQIRPSPK
jgi:MFS transporter, CP family, cyanate transporter